MLSVQDLPYVIMVALMRSLGLWHVALISLIASVVIEGIQLSHPMRGSNIDDVILNVAGAVAAAWAASFLLKRHEIDLDGASRAR